MKVVNHKAAEVHLHVDDKTKRLTLAPGVNEVDDAVWAKVKEHKVVKAMLAEEILEVGGKPVKEAIPSLREFVEAGYEPSGYLTRFPNAAVSKEEIDAAQALFEEEKTKLENDKKTKTKKHKE